MSANKPQLLTFKASIRTAADNTVCSFRENKSRLPVNLNDSHEISSLVFSLKKKKKKKKKKNTQKKNKKKNSIGMLSARVFNDTFRGKTQQQTVKWIYLKIEKTYGNELQ